MSGLLDAEAAREAFVDWMAANPNICNTDARSFLAGFAAGEAALREAIAEQIDTTPEPTVFIGFSVRDAWRGGIHRAAAIVRGGAA